MGGRSVDLSACVSLDDLKDKGWEPTAKPYDYDDAERDGHYKRLLNRIATVSSENPKAAAIILCCVGCHKTNAETARLMRMSTKQVQRLLAKYGLKKGRNGVLMSITPTIGEDIAYGRDSTSRRHDRTHRPA